MGVFSRGDCICNLMQDNFCLWSCFLLSGCIKGSGHVEIFDLLECDIMSVFVRENSFLSTPEYCSSFITFPSSDIIAGCYFSWMIFMSSKHQPPTVTSSLTLTAITSFFTLFHKIQPRAQHLGVCLIRAEIVSRNNDGVYAFWSLLSMGRKRKISLKLDNQRAWRSEVDSLGQGR